LFVKFKGKALMILQVQKVTPFFEKNAFPLAKTCMFLLYKKLKNFFVEKWGKFNTLLSINAIIAVKLITTECQFCGYACSLELPGNITAIVIF